VPALAPFAQQGIARKSQGVARESKVAARESKAAARNSSPLSPCGRRAGGEGVLLSVSHNPHADLDRDCRQRPRPTLGPADDDCLEDVVETQVDDLVVDAARGQRLDERAGPVDRHHDAIVVPADVE
jgi:hypothetical protein